MKRAAILGAGFSRAISSHMPITDGLGEMTIDSLAKSGVDVSARPFNGKGFEAWLSRLAEPQPDLNTAENLENQALFNRVSNALREVILTSQMYVTRSALPWWLQRLAGCYHYTNTTVATFNYDQLLEYALEAAHLRDRENRLVRLADALRYGPQTVAETPSGLAWPLPRAETFQILKLHGSVDSYWVPGDGSGASISRWDSKARWGNAFIPSDQVRRQLLPGRETFLIPPAAAKSSFYANPVSRELWQQASRALAEATHVDLVGYSVPMTDLVTAGMLGDRLRSSEAVITVVNVNAEPVVSALTRLGIDRDRIVAIEGEEACTDYTLSLEKTFQPRWTYEDPHDLGSPKLGVAMDSQVVDTAIVGCIPAAVDGIVELAVSELRSRAGDDAAITLHDFLTAAGDHSLPRARLVWPNGDTSFVASTELTLDGSQHEGWLTLQPTAAHSPA